MNKSSFFIVGKHPVIEALKNPKRKVLRIFLTEEAKKTIHRETSRKNLLKDLKVFFKTKKELDKYSTKDGLLHQGFVAEIEHLDEIILKEFIKNKNNLNLVCLDEVTDARNIGSIIRSAASFNLDGLIVKERHFPSESKLMFKSSSGAIEHLNIFKVANLNTALKYLKTKEFWVSAFDISAQKDFTKNNWKGKNVLLFGSEGYGIKAKTLENSDFKFKIHINNKIESLNIANTVSIVCHHVFQSTK